MSDFITDVVQLLKLWPTPIHLVSTILVLVSLWYFIKVVLLRILKQNELALRHQYASFFASVFILTALLLAVILDLKYLYTIVEFKGQGILLTSAMLLAIYSIIAWRRIRAIIKTFHSKDVGVYIGPIAYEKAKQFHIRGFYKRSVIALFLLLPFLILFVKPRQSALVSLVIDNSMSMQEQLDFLVAGLTEIAPSIQENIDYVITYIPECENCDDYNSKVNWSLEQITSKEIQDLNAKNVTFSGIKEALSYLEGIQLTNLGSPLFDCIWSNYLMCKDESGSKKYHKKVLLVFSDGEDNLFVDYVGVRAPKNCIFDIYNGQMKSFFDQISFVSYRGMGGTRLFDACRDIPLYDGNESASIVKALNKELRNYILDWSFIYFLMFIAILSIIIVLTTRI